MNRRNFFKLLAGVAVAPLMPLLPKSRSWTEPYQDVHVDFSNEKQYDSLFDLFTDLNVPKVSPSPALPKYVRDEYQKIADGWIEEHERIRAKGNAARKTIFEIIDEDSEFKYKAKTAIEDVAKHSKRIMDDFRDMT